MKKNLYSVYDMKSEYYLSPVTFHNDEDAKRGLASVFNNPDSLLAKYPGDYKLYNLGVFDDNSSHISPEIPPKFVCELTSLDPHPEEV